MPSRSLVPATRSFAVAAALVIAGCASSRPSENAAATAQSGLVAYAHCMRAHGVESFPDPVTREGIPKDKIVVSQNPQFAAASRACQHLMPASGLGPQTTPPPTRIRLAAALAFAKCVRDRGFPNFPDPTPQGQLTPEMVTAAGIDLHTRSLLQAGLACVPVTHGLITRAAVERAASGR